MGRQNRRRIPLPLGKVEKLKRQYLRLFEPAGHMIEAPQAVENREQPFVVAELDA
jgi:hypothetical protein